MVKIVLPLSHDHHLILNKTHINTNKNAMQVQ